MGDRDVETDEEVIAGFHQAIDNTVRDAQGPLYFGLVCITGDDGYVSLMRSMKACEGRHLREAAGLLLGYANKLTDMADKMEGEQVFLVPRAPERKPDPNAS
jgi:hypothetical protein